MDYKVVWTMEVFGAESAEDAAEMALASIREAYSEVLVFKVHKASGKGYSTASELVELEDTP